MLVYVEALFLDALIHSQACYLLDAPEEDDACHGSPSVDYQDTKCLSGEEAKASTVEGTAVEGKETRHERAEDAAYAVHTAGSHRVVNVELGVDELDAEHQQDACQQSDDGIDTKLHIDDPVGPGRPVCR